MTEKRKHHRGRRRKRKNSKKNLLSNIIFIVALIVFLIAAFQLARIGKGYLEGRGEYKEVIDLAIENEDDKEKFRVDFEKLMEINGDTIGWIRFYPEPSIISYPVVQGKDNDLYLHKTFSDSENTLGAIFVDMNNASDFSDKNTLIYGHRMKDGSMFRKLEDYMDKDFWKENPYFYIYTPDGKELTYHIYSVGVIKDTDENYQMSFENEEAFDRFIKVTENSSSYATGVEVTTDDTIVTLSTCTADSDNHRLVVHGVLEKEVELED